MKNKVNYIQAVNFINPFHTRRGAKFHLYYFKGRNFRGQKLSRVKKTAKFME